MKATGIVRRIDDLGRVVIPKEIRRILRIREGDPLEIYTESDGSVIFKKYSHIGEMSEFVPTYCEVLAKVSGMPILICDKDHVVAVSGISKKEYIERRITPILEELMQSRKSYILDLNLQKKSENFYPIEGIKVCAIIAIPIISAGDVAGSVIMLENGTHLSSLDSETKLLKSAAMFLGKQMES